jgi:hypothetical protein
VRLSQSTLAILAPAKAVLPPVPEWSSEKWAMPRKPRPGDIITLTSDGIFLGDTEATIARFYPEVSHA